MISNPIYGTIKNVPNHQPVDIYIYTHTFEKVTASISPSHSPAPLHLRARPTSRIRAGRCSGCGGLPTLPRPRGIGSPKGASGVRKAMEFHWVTARNHGNYMDVHPNMDKYGYIFFLLYILDIFWRVKIISQTPKVTIRQPTAPALGSPLRRVPASVPRFSKRMPNLLQQNDLSAAWCTSARTMWSLLASFGSLYYIYIYYILFLIEYLGHT